MRSSMHAIVFSCTPRLAYAFQAINDNVEATYFVSATYIPRPSTGCVVAAWN